MKEPIYNRTSIGILESLGLALLIAVTWLYAYLGLDWDLLWAGPVTGYEGDGIATLAQIRAYAVSDIKPFLSKFNDRLNAPFVANWNDFPAEDMVYAFPALFVNAFGLFAGINIYLMVLHVASGLSFYAASRILGYLRPWCLAGAMAYAFSPFLFFRGIAHLTVATTWHLPLLLVTLVWLNRPTQIPRITTRWMLSLGLASSALAGIFNPYYLAIYVFLLGVTLVGQLIAGNQQQAKRAALCIGVASGAFFVQNMDTLSFALEEGVNPDAAIRNLAGLTAYGLRLSDLIFPVVHRFNALAELSNSLYHVRIPLFLRGESQHSYVGVVALVGLLVLFIAGTAQVAARRFDDISNWFWIALGIVAFGVVGGLNYVAGAFGLEFLRATTRYSIMLMLVGLLFLGELLSQRRLGRYSWLVLLAVPLALYDQVPPLGMALRNLQTGIDQSRADRAFVAELEGALPGNAMVFQLPVKAFPETGSIFGMHDYDHFIPYLYSKDLRFSYGTTKGRGDADWQIAVGSLPLEQMVKQLERYGFSAVVLNRTAYADAAENLIAELRGVGRLTIAENQRMYAIRLSPVAKSVLPEVSGYHFRYGPEFSAVESNAAEIWRWVTEPAARINVRRSWLVNRRLVDLQEEAKLEFSLQGLERCNVWISVAGGPQRQVLAASEVRHYSLLAIDGASSNFWLEFRSDCTPKRPGDLDPRRLAFSVFNLRIQ